MKRSDHQIRNMLASTFVTCRALGENGLTPTGNKMALRVARNCLWAMGVEEYEGIKAEAPQGEVIDIGKVIELVALPEN